MTTTVTYPSRVVGGAAEVMSIQQGPQGPQGAGIGDGTTLVLLNLPQTDPGVQGQLWVDPDDSYRLKWSLTPLPTWILYGTFQLWNGSPYSGATIYLWDESAPTGDSVITDGNGDFQFEGLASGSVFGVSDFNNPNNPPPSPMYAEGDTAADGRAVFVSSPS